MTAHFPEFFDISVLHNFEKPKISHFVTHETRLTRPAILFFFFIKVPVPILESEQSCICVLGVSIDLSHLYHEINYLDLDFQQYFSYIMATSLSGGRSRSTLREPPTMGKQLVNFITCGCESSAPFL
jgi:hypothetical protein